MHLQLESCAVFQMDYVDVQTGRPAYTITRHYTTRDVTLEVVKYSGKRSDKIASIRCRELFPDTIELRDELPISVPTLTSEGQEYIEVVGECTRVKAKTYVRKTGKK